MPISRKPGETKEQFIPRCIAIEVNAGKPQDQAAAICYSYWEEKQLKAVKNIRKKNKKIYLESYNDYPEAAKENAKIALRWAEKNGWGSCGTSVGKQRANQLANGENISEDTIARMAGFERHRQNSQKELGDGCGRLMWLAWGGDEGIEWAQRKLKQIRGENFEMHFEKTRVFVESSWVDKMMWNSETQELIVKFLDGPIWTYPNVDEELFIEIYTGDAAPSTTGSNKWGSWVRGDAPSVGAAIHQKLLDKNIRGFEGGSFR